MEELLKALIDRSPGGALIGVVSLAVLLYTIGEVIGRVREKESEFQKILPTLVTQDSMKLALSELKDELRELFVTKHECASHRGCRVSSESTSYNLNKGNEV